MSCFVAHFSINADDTSRARSFYENVFGWKFSGYGPPDFFMIDMGEAPAGPMHASLQKRREIVKGTPMYGFENTISVPDVRKAKAAIEANGGAIVMSICTLPGIGQLLFFRDPEGNIAGAMQYDSKAD